MTEETVTVQKIQEVSALLAVPDSHIIAGGTTFPANTAGLRLVDISALEGLNSIKQKGNRIEIGPLATLRTVSESAVLKKYHPALTDAAASAGPADILDRGTIGGNLAALPIGDTAPALLATGAKLTIKTDSDYREQLIDRFWDQNGQNSLLYDEWITRISLPLPKDALWGAAYGKYSEWGLQTEPVTSAAVQLSLNNSGVITAIRSGIRLGTSTISRMFPLERKLKNQIASDENFRNAIHATAPVVRDFMDETEFSDFLLDIVQRAYAMAEERRTH